MSRSKTLSQSEEHLSFILRVNANGSGQINW
jgi:hypothetical protein